MKKNYLAKIFKMQGMSMIEVMVMLGITTAISLGFVQLIDDQSSSFRDVKVKTEENSVFERIEILMMDPGNCTSTLNTIALGGAVPSIILKGPGSHIAFSAGATYGSNSFQIVNMVADDINNLAGGALPTTGDIELVINTRRIGEKRKGSEDFSKRILLTVDVDGAGNISGCPATVTTTLDPSMDVSCGSLGGTYNVGLDQCEFNCNLGTPSDWEILSTDCLINDAVPNHMSPRYLDVGTSETITGNTTFNGLIQVNGDIRSNNLNLYNANDFNNADLIVGAGGATLGGQAIATETQLFSNLTPAQKDTIVSDLVTAAASQTGVNAMSQTSRSSLSVNIPSCPVSEVMQGISYNSGTGQFSVNCVSFSGGACPTPAEICSGSTYISGDGFCNVPGTKTCCPPAADICTGDTYTNGSGCNVVGTKSCAPPPSVHLSQSRQVVHSQFSTFCDPYGMTPFVVDSTMMPWGPSCAATCPSASVSSITITTPAACVFFGYTVPGNCGSTTCSLETRQVICNCNP